MDTRQQDLKDRFDALKDKNATIHGLGFRNVALYFKEEILEHSFHDIAENRMVHLETVDAAHEEVRLSVLWKENRKKEYRAMDEELMEALAEKEMGDNTKMEEYKVKRNKTKSRYPKQQ